MSARVQASGSWPRLPGADLGRPAGMSEPVCDVPADSDAVPVAVANARRGVITHLTIAGERVAAIVPESVIEARGRHALKGVTSPTCGSGSVVTGSSTTCGRHYLAFRLPWRRLMVLLSTRQAYSCLRRQRAPENGRLSAGLA